MPATRTSLTSPNTICRPNHTARFRTTPTTAAVIPESADVRDWLPPQGLDIGRAKEDPDEAENKRYPDDDQRQALLDELFDHQLSSGANSSFATAPVLGDGFRVTWWSGTTAASTTWHAAATPTPIHLIVTAKNGISSVELGRRLGVKQPTAWAVKHKIMAVMARREGETALTGRVEMDDAYLGGVRSGGKRGRGAAGKTPFVAAVYPG